jgi:hypothetical protein
MNKQCKRRLVFRILLGVSIAVLAVAAVVGWLMLAASSCSEFGAINCEEFTDGQKIAVPALAVTFAAFCLWLTVRIVNRRERWAKWTLAGTVIGVPVLYVASFGPACWIYSRTDCPSLSAAYFPIGWVISEAGRHIDIQFVKYAVVGMPRGSSIDVPMNADGMVCTINH